MPEWLSGYLSRHELRIHFWRALVLGLSLRLLSAFFVYGPQALDDYKHGVWPAYQFFAGLALNDFPNYRSHLLVWFLSGFVQIASWFGVSSALGQVRAMYAGLALTSLLGLWGTYRYAQLRPQALVSRLMLYLIAAYPLLPFVSTRAFGEAVAMSLVLAGFGSLEHTRARAPHNMRAWFAGFMWLGLATLFRFHCGLLFCFYWILSVRNRAALSAGVLAGLTTLGLQAGIDWASGKGVLETLVVYLNENEGGGAKYGVSPWYTTWLFVLAVFFLPFSFPLFRNARGLWREQKRVLMSWLFFVGVHSLVAHKEERFLYPVLGLEIWGLAELWAAAQKDGMARRFFSPIFLSLAGLMLLVTCLINSQEGEIEPPAYVQSHYDNVTYLDNASLFGQSRFQFYFLRPPSQMIQVEVHDFNAKRIDDALIEDRQKKAVVLLTSNLEAYPQLRALEGVKTLAGECRGLREAGSLIDRLLFKLNPKHNQRRRPTWYLICERQNGV